MKCPYCDSEMEKGVMLVTGNVQYFSWYPEAEREKIFKDSRVSLKNIEGNSWRSTEGYYCHFCGRSIAVFDKR